MAATINSNIYLFSFFDNCAVFFLKKTTMDVGATWRLCNEAIGYQQGRNSVSKRIFLPRRPCYIFLNFIKHHGRRIKTSCPGNFLHSGRAGDINFGEIITNHIQTSQHQAILM